MPVISKKADTFFIAAGEPSGDLLAADLVLALRERMPRLAAFGITGGAMLNAGVDSVASIDELSVMGVTDVARKLAGLRMLETKVLAWVDRMAPRFAVLVDNPGFNLRLAEQLRMRGIRVFQYVAPKLWAWGEGRAPGLRDNLDMVLGILPFEEKFFKERSINYTYVGSPLKDRIDKVIVRRAALGIPDGRKVIALLPGSRMSELRFNLPTMLAVKALVHRTLPDAQFVVPLASNLAVEDVEALLGAKLKESPPSGELAVTSYEPAGVPGLRFVRGMSLEIMAAADAAVVASGTATLECALLGTPLVVVYTMSDLTYQIAKRAVKIPYVSLVNLMAGKRLVAEFIQDFSHADIAVELLSLVQDTQRRKTMLQQFEDIRDKLKGTAADNAAAVIAGRCGDSAPVS